MAGLKVGPDELKKIEEIQKNLRLNDKISAIVNCAELAYTLVSTSECGYNPGQGVFEDACLKLSEQIYDQEKQRAGITTGLKKKIIPKTALNKNGMQ